MKDWFSDDAEEGYKQMKEEINVIHKDLVHAPLEASNIMSEPNQCKQCAQSIETGEMFARFKNPDPMQPPLVFHHRGRGDCYWLYLRDQALKVQGQPRPNV
jgi:hypothetical protein